MHELGAEGLQVQVQPGEAGHGGAEDPTQQAGRLAVDLDSLDVGEDAAEGCVDGLVATDVLIDEQVPRHVDLLGARPSVDRILLPADVERAII